MDTKVDLILDSGAFSAWRQRKTLPLSEYMTFINRYKSSIWKAVNLDVIPGAGFGSKPTPDEVEASAKQGYENLLEMRKNGIEGMPVFHMGERMYWLDRMVDEGYDWIGISPANDRTTEQKQDWLDEVFGHLCGKEGFPKVRTHGFGVTALPLLFRYPWYSADSISWILFGAYRMILIPRTGVDGGYDYRYSPLAVYVSNKSSKDPDSMNRGTVTSLAGMSYDSLGPSEKSYVDKYLESEGFNVGVTRSTYIERLKVNLRFFKNIMSSYRLQPFHKRASDLFAKRGVDREGSPVSLFGDQLKLIFTTTTSREHSELLNIEGIRERLISWFHIHIGDKMDVESYVKTGLMLHVTPRGQKRPKKMKERPKAVEAPVTPRIRLRSPS